MSGLIQVVIPSRDRDLGGFHVHRVLPYAQHRMVGPFVFFDHMGPADFPAGQGIQVRPHPHINLATVTYLFKGRIRHRDSLGSDLVIEPGAVNWMTAGRGIVHSERALDEDLKSGSSLNGIQLWVALPVEFEERDPEFSHHAKETLPEFSVNQVKMKLLLGEAFGRKSPVPVKSDLFYVEADLKSGQSIEMSADQREMAFYVVQGKISSGGQVVEPFCMGVVQNQSDLKLEALADSKVMLIGGKSLGAREIFWNFVSSSAERIEAAKKEWSSQGPTASSLRFNPIPGDDSEYIPL